MERDSLLILDKQFDKLMADSLKDLGDTEISNEGPGGIARLLLAIVNKPIANIYKVLKVEQAQAFLSKATEGNIDLIGDIVNCERYAGEPDDEYKYRISRQTLTLERANETAVRLAVLSTPGVTDVIMREFSHGTGSFTVYPVLNNPFDWDAQMLSSIHDKLHETKSFGIRAIIMKPRLSYVELRGRLSLSKRMTDADRALIANNVTQAVRTYIGALKPGEQISINRINTLALGISADIISINIHHFLINNRAMLVVDQEPSWNERYIEAQNSNAISFN
jgi:hypothetical protein